MATRARRPRQSATIDFLAYLYAERNDANAIREFVSLRSRTRTYVVEADLPIPLTERLSKRGFHFHDLPGIVQYALLWDHGLVFQAATNTLHRIWTACGLSMGTLTTTEPMVENEACTIDNGSGCNNVLCWNPRLTLSHIQCAIERIANVSIISSSESPPTWSIPHFPNATGVQVSLISHPSPFENVTSFAIVPLVPSDAMSPCTALRIPCVAYDNATAMHQDPTYSWCPPQPTSLMDTWLDELLSETTTSLSGTDGTPWLDRPSQLLRGALTMMQFQTNRLSDALNHVNDTVGDFSTTSDFARQYYRLHTDGASEPRLELTNALPPDIRQRLDEVGVTFSDIPGLLQRAVIWDSGYAMVHRHENDDRVDLVRVYTRCGLQMNDLVLPAPYVQDAGCLFKDCSWIDKTTQERIVSRRAATSCASAQDQSILNMSVCAVEAPSFAMDASTTSIWAVGSMGRTVPMPQLRNHRLLGQTYQTMYAIHTSNDWDVDAMQCPMTPSTIIPCQTYTDNMTDSGEWCRPQPSAIVTGWIMKEEYQNRALLTLLLTAGTMLLAVALDLFSDRKPWRLFRSNAVGDIPTINSMDLSRLTNTSSRAPEGTNSSAASRTRVSSMG